MQLQTGITYLWKCLIGGLIFYLGLVVGSMLALSLGMQPPPMPEGMDRTIVSTYVLLSSPIFVLALAFVARSLPGGYVARAGVLTIFAWIVYGVNNVIEASLITSYTGFSWLTVISFGVASLLCGAATAFLFAPTGPSESMAAAWYASFNRRSALSWVWRLLVATVIFAPIYLVFGLLVLPVVEEYYQQQVYGLVAPTWQQLLPILLMRSVLFMLACLPIVMTWQGSRRSLVLSLGFALFVLSGLVPLLQAYWMPVTLRIPHSLEILADSYVYAWALALLLGKENIQPVMHAPRPQLKQVV
jgi:hypothetical protein